MEPLAFVTGTDLIWYRFEELHNKLMHCAAKQYLALHDQDVVLAGKSAGCAPDELLALSQIRPVPSLPGRILANLSAEHCRRSIEEVETIAAFLLIDAARIVVAETAHANEVQLKGEAFGRPIERLLAIKDYKIRRLIRAAELLGFRLGQI